MTGNADGPAAAIGHIRQVCADLPARPGLLLGDPATAAWLVRTALAAGRLRLLADNLALDWTGPGLRAAAPG